MLKVLKECFEQVLKECFDFDAIKALFARKDFSFCYDALSGVQGPYAKAVFWYPSSISPPSVGPHGLSVACACGS